MAFQQNAFQPIAFQAPILPSPLGPIITGTYGFNPDVADAMEEAFERAGIAAQAIGTEHIASALRSLRYMLNSEWANYGIRQWTIQQGSYTLQRGDVYFDIPAAAGATDVLFAMLRRNNEDTVMYPISRDDYNAIATKFRQGRPSQYFADKQYNHIRMYLWSQPENSTDIVKYDYIRQIADVGRMGNAFQLPAHALDCMVSGLAMRLALKYSPERYAMLKLEYGGTRYPDELGGKLFHMRAQSGERSDTQFTFTRRR